MTAEPSAPPSVSNWTTTASSVVTSRTTPSPLPRAKASRSSPRTALGHDDRGARGEPGEPVAGDELGEVAPVRADVREGARDAAPLGVDAPVVVLGVEQPVLQVCPVDEVHGAAPAGGDAVARLAHGGVEAVRERHGRARRGVGREGREALRRVEIDRERLLADDVLAGRQGALRQVRVEVVRRADVDDVDRRVVDEGLGALVGRLGAEAAGRLARPLRARGGHAGEDAAGGGDGAGMDGPDEAGARDRGPQGPPRHCAHRHDPPKTSDDCQAEVCGLVALKVVRLRRRILLYSADHGPRPRREPRISRRRGERPRAHPERRLGHPRRPRRDDGSGPLHDRPARRRAAGRRAHLRGGRHRVHRRPPPRPARLQPQGGRHPRRRPRARPTRGSRSPTWPAGRSPSWRSTWTSRRAPSGSSGSSTTAS